MPDIRKTLPVLKSEWETCTKCELGVSRLEVGGAFVFGEGQRGGVMFIGEGPGGFEEIHGRPFVGDSGAFLRNAIANAHIDRFYISNVVACRSWAYDYDGEGQLRMRVNRDTGEEDPVIIDRPPTPPQTQACLPRIHEEIYLVDPLVIVGLGAESCKALTGKAISVTRESGEGRIIKVPGASFTPNLTTKKKVWVRKVKGHVVMPVDQNMVDYFLVPLIHPAYVLRNISDERNGSPLHIFVEGMKKVAAIYKRLLQEGYGDLQSTQEYA
jgi:uracil-DNA glycosylase